jgi:hypothetical protein
MAEHEGPYLAIELLLDYKGGAVPLLYNGRPVGR